MLIWWKVVSLADEVDELKYERASSDDTLSSVNESSKTQEESKRISEEARPVNTKNAYRGKKLLPTMFSRTVMQRKSSSAHCQIEKVQQAVDTSIE